ncbi:helix-turn-helix domain-containing protein [Paenibacillus methanolicus]|uniref:AraC-like protein n=1 Tax=Paenibacillus methanolicus TaxID=582686 RepID=A0A5S5C6I9_9BACL|nr:AraC family transcriptional regulator [Paenibacillus methanolicus]TYP74779.1 AraC-like protein [Paenibacillus methanolicus]
MDFSGRELSEALSIRKLISFHYFEYAKGFTFDGEAHDFWELLYVDKGEVEVRAGERTHLLKAGMVIFHQPGEFHAVRVGAAHKPPNLIVMAWACESPHLNRLAGKIAALGNEERNLLSLLLQEGFRTYKPPFDDPYAHGLSLREDAPFAGEQALKSFLTLLLIRLIRNECRDEEAAPDKRKLTSARQEKAEQRIVRLAIAYMKDNLSEALTLDDLCREVHLGRSQLKRIFRTHMAQGALDCFKRLKIEEAKTMIREELYNFSEIAAKLGYASLHYFSRDFKRAVGMSPSEYAKSTQARIGVRGQSEMLP